MGRSRADHERTGRGDRRGVAARIRGPRVKRARLSELRQAVVDAAIEIDGVLLRQALDQAFAAVSPQTVIEQVLVPAARDIGTLWERGVVSVAGEHLVSAHLSYRLQQLVEHARTSSPGSSVVCACLPEEQHELGLQVVTLLLVSAGFDVSYLGRRVPAAEAERACFARRPVALCLSVSFDQLLADHAADLVELGLRWQGQLQLHLGGRAVPGEHLALQAAGFRLWPHGAGASDLARAVTSQP